MNAVVREKVMEKERKIGGVREMKNKGIKEGDIGFCSLREREIYSLHLLYSSSILQP